MSLRSLQNTTPKFVFLFGKVLASLTCVPNDVVFPTFASGCLLQRSFLSRVDRYYIFHIRLLFNVHTIFLIVFRLGKFVNTSSWRMVLEGSLCRIDPLFDPSAPPLC